VFSCVRVYFYVCYPSFGCLLCFFFFNQWRRKKRNSQSFAKHSIWILKVLIGRKKNKKVLKEKNRRKKKKRPLIYISVYVTSPNNKEKITVYFPSLKHARITSVCPVLFCQPM